MSKDTPEEGPIVPFNVRVPKADADQVDELVDQHKFLNRSDATRTAIRKLIDDSKGAG